MDDYDERVRQQIAQYAQVENMHELPDAFHVWSQAYIGPGFEHVFQISPSVAGLYAAALADVPRDGPARLFSIGCGDGWLEIEVAKQLLAAGEQDFTIVASDLNPGLIERFAAKVAQDGLGTHFSLSVADLNAATLPGPFDVVIANQVLHHVERLEELYAAVRAALKPGGIFASNDVIGRNGHMRWPEVLGFVEAYWRLLRPEQRFNVLLQRGGERFIDHDCSTEGFEGIRAQEVLPLLLKQFYPKRFFATGGLVDVFVDRAYGHAFKMGRRDDRALIESIAQVSDSLLDAGLTKPTIMFGHFVAEPCEERYYRGRSAELSVRDPAA